MPLLPLEHFLAHVDSKYRLVIIAAKRAKQLMRGAEPLIAPKSFKPTYIALEEVGAETVNYEAEPAEGALAIELASAEVKPTWFRSLSAGETLAEGVMIDEEEEGTEETDLEATPQELLVESSEIEVGQEMTDLDGVTSQETVEEDA